MLSRKKGTRTFVSLRPILGFATRIRDVRRESGMPEGCVLVDVPAAGGFAIARLHAPGDEG
jgi:hypothetical protein